MRRFITSNPEETMEQAKELYPLLGEDQIVCFFGELGSGKTTFIKGLAKALDIPETVVSSPTFTYLNIYEGKDTLYHFDLYRLRDKEEFLSLGFDEFLFSKGLKCLEWSERIESILPPSCVKISMKGIDKNKREIFIL